MPPEPCPPNPRLSFRDFLGHDDPAGCVPFPEVVKIITLPFARFAGKFSEEEYWNDQEEEKRVVQFHDRAGNGKAWLRSSAAVAMQSINDMNPRGPATPFSRGINQEGHGITELSKKLSSHSFEVKHPRQFEANRLTHCNPRMVIAKP
jgi:hypothetical protein